MLPDIKIKDFYLQFIRDAKVDKCKATELLNTLIANKKEIKEVIKTFEEEINNKYNIVLNSFVEYSDEVFDESSTLDRRIDVILSGVHDLYDRNKLLQIRKYCNILSRENTANNIIKFADKKIQLKFSEYRSYITKYYQEVHKQVLQGHGYKFKYGIGTFIINKWKNIKNANGKNSKTLDFAATYARKKELLDKGIELYDDKKATWCKARNIEYNAVDYRVYRYDTDYYEINFINSSIVKNSSLDYQRTEYLHAKFRGMSYIDIADTCKTAEDIYGLPVDIKYKLNIFLYKYPNKYLNFIRNGTQNKYQHRNNYCKNRQ